MPQTTTLAAKGEKKRSVNKENRGNHNNCQRSL